MVLVRGRKEKKCVRDPAKDFGVFHSLTILRDNPLQTHMRGHIQLINMDTHTCTLSGCVNEGERFHRHMSSRGWCVTSSRDEVESSSAPNSGGKWWLPILLLRPPADRAVSYKRNTAYAAVFLSCALPPQERAIIECYLSTPAGPRQNTDRTNQLSL